MNFLCKKKYVNFSLHKSEDGKIYGPGGDVTDNLQRNHVVYKLEFNYPVWANEKCYVVTWLL